MKKYWIGVASKNHVMAGVEGGFAMANHGKSAPLKRMSSGDIVIFYAPKLELGKDEPCQKFVAIGEIVSGEIYQVKMSKDFEPYRLDVKYFDCLETEIRPMLGDLEFIEDKQKWGYKFRFGHFEIFENDYKTIANAMNAKPV